MDRLRPLRFTKYRPTPRDASRQVEYRLLRRLLGRTMDTTR